MRISFSWAVFGLVVLVLAASAEAVKTGGCGSSAGGQALVVNPRTGDVVTVGIEGIAVRVGSISSLDLKRVRVPYATEVFAPAAGDRFVVRKGKDLHVFDFTSYRLLYKRSVKALKDLSVWRWHWIDGGDEVIALGAVYKTGLFGTGGKTGKPSVVRLNLSSGEESLIPLDMPELRAAAFDLTGSRVAVCFADGRVEVRSTADGRVVGGHTLHREIPWNTMGLAFHPEGRLLGSCDGSELVLYDLERGQPAKRLQGITGGKFLQFVLGGRYLLAGDTTVVGFYDISGRRLEQWRASEGQDFLVLQVVEELRKVFTLGSEWACWHTFLAWQKAADAK